MLFRGLCLALRTGCQGSGWQRPLRPLLEAYAQIRVQQAEAQPVLVLEHVGEVASILPWRYNFPPSIVVPRRADHFQAAGEASLLDEVGAEFCRGNFVLQSQRAQLVSLVAQLHEKECQLLL